jgi:hypothetical protein
MCHSRMLASHLQPLDRLLICSFDRVQPQVLVDCEALLARMSGQELNMGIGELLGLKRIRVHKPRSVL